MKTMILGVEQMLQLRSEDRLQIKLSRTSTAVQHTWLEDIFRSLIIAGEVARIIRETLTHDTCQPMKIRCSKSKVASWCRDHIWKTRLKAYFRDSESTKIKQATQRVFLNLNRVWIRVLSHQSLKLASALPQRSTRLRLSAAKAMTTIITSNHQLWPSPHSTNNHLPRMLGHLPWWNQANPNWLQLQIGVPTTTTTCKMCLFRK